MQLVIIEKQRRDLGQVAKGTPWNMTNFVESEIPENEQKVSKIKNSAKLY